MTEKQQATSPAESGSDEIPVSQLSYTEASRELDEIVEFFEHRDVDVDQLVARLERATSIVDELDRRVRRTRSQVERLVPRLQATARGEDSESNLEQESNIEQDDEDEEDEESEQAAEDIDVSVSAEPELFS
jgi:exonuclease VII small subunit